MSEDIYAKPDLSKKVRFQTEKHFENAEVYDNTDNVTIYDNHWEKESTSPKLEDTTTEDQQQTTSVSVPSENRNLVRPAAGFLALLCLLLLAIIIVLVILLIQDRSDKLQARYSEVKSLNANLTSERDELQARYGEVKSLNANLTSERDELQARYGEVKSLNADLTSERDELQARYGEVKSLNADLTLEKNQLEKDNDLLMATKIKLTKEKAKLQEQLATSCCPANWIKFGNSCYLLSTSKKTWPDSSQFCEEHQAQLVIVSSEEEQRFLSSFMRSVWIGLTDRKKENTWKWVDDTMAKTLYWGSHQPDNWVDPGKPREDEDCVHIGNNYHTIYPNLNTWNDVKCSAKMHFICEKILI